MAFALDTQAHIPTTASATSTATTLSIGYTCGAYDGVLIVYPIWAGTTARTGGSPTYAGSPLTEVLTQQTVTETSIEAWYMLSPPSGSYTLSVPNSGGRTMWVDIASAKSTSASLTFALDSTSSSATTAANPGVTITTLVAPTMIWVGVGTGDNTWLPTGLSGSATYNDDIGNYGGGVQYAVKETTGAQRISWTDATSDDYNILAVAFKEVARNFSSGVTNNATQAQTAENVTLTYNAPPSTLAVNDATQAQTADKIALTAHYILSLVNDTIQLQTSDKITITAYEPASQTVTQNATQLQTSENVVLTAHYVLTSVQDAIQLQTTDNIALTAHYILASVTDATQNQNTDNIILSMRYSLIVQDTTQLQTAQSFLLMPVRLNGARVFDGTTDRIDYSSKYTFSGSPVSFSIWVQFDRINIYQILLNVQDITNGSANLYLASPGNSRVGSVGMYIKGATYGWRTGAINTVAIGVWYNLIFTWDGIITSLASHVHIYKDGIEIGYDNTQNGTLPLSNMAGIWSLGNVNYIDSSMFKGKIAEVAAWDRVLTTEEIAQLVNRNNLKSATFIPSGLLFVEHPDEPKDLWTNELGILDGTTLSYGPDLDFPDYSLVVQDATQAQTSENTTLSANYSIITQDATQAQTSENIILSAHYSIIINDAIQLQNSSDIILAAIYTLVINNAFQTQTSDNVTLGVGAIGVPRQMMHYIRLRSK